MIWEVSNESQSGKACLLFYAIFLFHLIVNISFVCFVNCRMTGTIVGSIKKVGGAHLFMGTLRNKHWQLAQLQGALRLIICEKWGGGHVPRVPQLLRLCRMSF